MLNAARQEPLLAKIAFAVYLPMILSISTSVKSENGLVQNTIVDPSDTQTVWSGWNIKGSLHFQIGSPSTSDLCVTAWWNKNGFKSDKFEICNGGALPYSIPPYLFARLKVGWPLEKTVVSVSTEASVNSLYEVCHPLGVDCL